MRLGESHRQQAPKLIIYADELDSPLDVRWFEWNGVRYWIVREDER